MGTAGQKWTKKVNMFQKVIVFLPKVFFSEKLSQRSTGKQDMPSVATQDMPSVATHDMSSVATADITSVSTEDMSSVSTECC